jgi:hypothetical protein
VSEYQGPQSGCVYMKCTAFRSVGTVVCSEEGWAGELEISTSCLTLWKESKCKYNVLRLVRSAQ